jgi:hypothetical protein
MRIPTAAERAELHAAIEAADDAFSVFKKAFEPALPYSTFPALRRSLRSLCLLAGLARQAQGAKQIPRSIRSKQA